MKQKRMDQNCTMYTVVNLFKNEQFFQLTCDTFSNFHLFFFLHF